MGEKVNVYTSPRMKEKHKKEIDTKIMSHQGFRFAATSENIFDQCKTLSGRHI